MRLWKPQHELKQRLVDFYRRRTIGASMQLISSYADGQMWPLHQQFSSSCSFCSTFCNCSFIVCCCYMEVARHKQHVNFVSICPKLVCHHEYMVKRCKIKGRYRFLLAKPLTRLNHRSNLQGYCGTHWLETAYPSSQSSSGFENLL